MAENGTPTHDLKLADLVDMTSPQKTLNEVRFIVGVIASDFDFRPLSNIFYDIYRLFRGEYAGYRACYTEYHNCQHTTDTFIALARLAHGYIISGGVVSPHHLFLGLTTALMHDTGYIQTEEDCTGTGAKYTRERVSRSISFMEKYLHRQGFSPDDIAYCTNCMTCIGIANAPVSIEQLERLTSEELLMGKLLGTADLLGQIADRMYLEKLLFLFYEFREGDVPGYETELELLRKTIRFYELARKRLTDDYDNLLVHMSAHFRERWGAERNLYLESMEKNIEYLRFLLAHHEQDYRNYLRRGNILKKLYQRSG